MIQSLPVTSVTEIIKKLNLPDMKDSSSSKASTSSAGQNKVSNHFLSIAQQEKQAMAHWRLAHWRLAQSFTNTTKTNADITKPSVIEAGPSSTNSNLSTIEMNPQNVSYNSGFYFSNVFEVPIAVPVAQYHANQLTETANLSNNGRIKQAIQANNPSNNNKNISDVSATQNHANQPTEKENLPNNYLIKQPISSEQKAENSSNNNKNISEVPTAVPATQNYANQSATPTIPKIIAKLPPCIVCLEEPDEPISTDCGHLFCLACIKESLKRKSVCPMCNKTMTSKSYRRLYI